jgi:hypothetical protein
MRHRVELRTFERPRRHVFVEVNAKTGQEAAEKAVKKFGKPAQPLSIDTVGRDTGRPRKTNG